MISSILESFVRFGKCLMYDMVGPVILEALLSIRPQRGSTQAQEQGHTGGRLLPSIEYKHTGALWITSHIQHTWAQRGTVCTVIFHDLVIAHCVRGKNRVSGEGRNFPYSMYCIQVPAKPSGSRRIYPDYL